MKFRRLIIAAGLVSGLALAAYLTIPRGLPWALSRVRPDILFVMPSARKEVFLTIDDAPGPRTGEILAVLKKHGVPATFFVIANRVSDPRQLEEIVAAGHRLGNHLRSTKACSQLSQEEFAADLDACTAVLSRAGPPRWFRPSSDFGTEGQIAFAKSRGYRAVMGTIFPLDHWIDDPGRLVRLARWLTVPGGIIILHDGEVRGSRTAVVLDRLIPELRAAGYSFGRLETEE